MNFTANLAVNWAGLRLVRYQFAIKSTVTFSSVLLRSVPMLVAPIDEFRVLQPRCPAGEQSLQPSAESSPVGPWMETRHQVKKGPILCRPNRLWSCLGWTAWLGVLTGTPGLAALEDAPKSEGGAGIGAAAQSSAHTVVAGPVLVYSTYLGGANAERAPLFDGLLSGTASMAVDSAGSVYVTGSTASSDFPTTSDLNRTLGGGRDAVVTKFSPAGRLIYSTYLGGACEDLGRGIAIDLAGNAYVTGRANEGCSNAGVFVAKLDSTGHLTYFYTFGGSLADTSFGTAIAVDSGGHAYVTGVAKSLSRDFPTTVGAFRTVDCGAAPDASGHDVFVAKINAAGDALVYSTYLCGTADDWPSAIAVDIAGNAYVAGGTTSQDFPTVNAFQAWHHSGPDNYTGFTAKVDPTGANIVYSTYLGGTSGAIIGGMTLDGRGNVYVTGQTAGDTFPTTPGVVQPSPPNPDCFPSGCTDAFVAKLDPAGALLYSTLLGGERDDGGSGIAIDPDGNVYVIGDTFSRFFPVRNAIKSTNTLGEQDAFITKLNSDATRIIQSTYLGGTKSPNSSSALEGTDSGVAIGLDAANNIYVTGYTWSLNFPTTSDAFQPNASAGSCGFGEPCGDLFVSKFTAGGPGAVQAMNLEVLPAEVRGGGTIWASWSSIPEPSARDQLILVPLGALTEASQAAQAASTSGTGDGRLALALAPTVAPGTYELRLVRPNPTLPSELVVIARSEPVSVLGPPLLTAALESGDTVCLRFRGLATKRYDLLATDSLNPSHWQQIAVLTPDASGVAEFRVKRSATPLARFYTVTSSVSGTL